MKNLFECKTKSIMASLGFVLCCVVGVTVMSVSAAYAGDAGSVKYARGAVTLQNKNGTQARLVAAKEKFKEGDVLKTGPKSFAIIRLEDGTRMTLRPKTTFAVESMKAEKTSTASAILNLFRGGMRTITGFISKYNKTGYKMRTPVATIGIRGTEFDARLCEDDCAQENKKIEDKHNQEVDEAVARAVFVRGTLNAKSFAGRDRVVKAGESVFEGDTLSTGKTGYAILVFRDKSRVSLQRNTEFRIDEMKYRGTSAEQTKVASQDGEESAEIPAVKAPVVKNNSRPAPSALFSLLRGGLRAVTGLIGKLSPNSYRMRTRVATIGIRGTGYDALCVGTCASGGTPASGGSDKSEDFSAYVWLGKITVGGVELDTNQAAFLDNKTGTVRLFPIVPEYFKNNEVPKPNLYKVQNEDKLFSKLSGDKVEKGLFVNVTKGEVSVTSDQTGKYVLVEAGESGFAGVNGGKVGNVGLPAFIQYDSIPRPNNELPEAITIGDAVLGGGHKALVCEIK